DELQKAGNAARIANCRQQTSLVGARCWPPRLFVLARPWEYPAGRGRVTLPRMIKRIAVLGSGAIGSVVGGMLTKAGHDVTLVDQWPEHVGAMREGGLWLAGNCGGGVVPLRALHLGELRLGGGSVGVVF